MKLITQTRFSKDPTPESRGNCMQAAVASILGLELDDVPNFVELPLFWRSVQEFFASLGLSQLEFDTTTRCAPDGVNYLAYGPTVRGTNHAVIHRDGKLLWDPHPSRAGLLKINMTEMLVPLDLAHHVAATKRRIVA